MQEGHQSGLIVQIADLIMSGCLARTLGFLAFLYLGDLAESWGVDGVMLPKQTNQGDP